MSSQMILSGRGYEFGFISDTAKWSFPLLSVLVHCHQKFQTYRAIPPEHHDLQQYTPYKVARNT